MEDDAIATRGHDLRVVSLFSGIGGLDRGLELAGHTIVEMCESWEPARRVLRDRFGDIHIAPDIATYVPKVSYDVLAAGFPCTDISHAGTKSGIFGPASGLVEHVFRIARLTEPSWIVLENVPNLLTLHRGAGIAHVVARLEELGYSWAYRTVDSRFTGVPQRRPRVVLVASLRGSPASALFAGDAALDRTAKVRAAGFYWTEGRNGLGFVHDAVPTLKGGSTLGLPSAPAVWKPMARRGGKFVLPSIEQGEALQGFPAGWTESAAVVGEPDSRWKLVGNAVTVGVGRWIGDVLAVLTANPERDAKATDAPKTAMIDKSRPWPKSGYGSNDVALQADAGLWPRLKGGLSLDEVVTSAGATPLSHRATKGFLSRLDESGRQVDAEFYADLEEHLAATRPPLTAQGLMSKQRRKHTTTEPALRRALHARGLRYRLQVRPLPDLRCRLDLVFAAERLAVDVRGCFWHGCTAHEMKPRAKAERWAAKVARNVERDEETVDALQAAGWEVVVVWEHEDPEDAAHRVAALVTARREDREKSTLMVR